MTSYVTDGTVGPWAKEKLDCLSKYLEAYTTILRKQPWSHYIFIDAFAGAGKAPLRQYKNSTDGLPIFDEVAYFTREQETQTDEYVLGSPNVALNIKHPFLEYFFIEKNPDRVGELQKLEREFGAKRKIEVLQGDANTQILEEILRPGKYNWRKTRAVAFLDPFGMQVPWSTLVALGNTRGIELILNLPVGMAIQRLLPKSGQFSEEERKKLNDYFGSSDWEREVYDEQLGLFGFERTKKSDSGARLALWYQSRLKEAFGYAAKPRLITNTRGTHLYYLLWAGPNATGMKIASHVLKQGKEI